MKTKIYAKKLHRAWLWTRIRQVRFKRWWFKNDRRYGLWWRLGNGAAALLILVATAIPVAQQWFQSNAYALSSAALNMVGNTDPTLTKQLTYDTNTQTYQFNQSAVKSSATVPQTLQAQIGTASGRGKDKSLYALDVPADFASGVTYHDINSQLNFTLVPEFSALPAKVVQGHLVFPVSGGGQAVYTLKNNGLKEDIVVPKVTGDSLTFSYRLDLPKTLEAKVIPNSGGNIGIYSADPALFGNITYGSAQDQAAVEKARENAPKTNLVFGLPSPVIKAPNGGSIGNASARFVLNGNQLSVVVSDLSGLTTPIDIDPSVVVTSTSDFQTGGNNEDDIDFSTSGQITRGGLTGGTISGGWSSPVTAGNISNYAVAGAAYNGYLYDLGGSSATKGSTALYAAINGDGSITTWNTTTSLPIPLEYPSAEVYNGYLYVYGGYNFTTSAESGAVYYTPINSDGTLGSTWTQTSSMLYAVCRQSSAIYNGYLYSLGGEINAPSTCGNTGTPTTYVQYAPINADGSVGTWQSTNGFTYATTYSPNGVFSGGSFAYNGYIYMMGGTYDGSHNYKTIQYARLNADGSVGTWITNATTLPYLDYRFGLVAYNGYMYYFRGSNSTGETDYAPINANGSIGTLRTSVTLSITRWGAGIVAYNGYIYAFNGAEPSGNNNNDTIWAQIDPAGTANAYTTSTSFTTTRQGSQAVAYNGMLYEMGGVNGSAATNTIYAATINSDGHLGSFTNTGMTAFTTNRAYFAAFAYGGNMYVIGGCSSTYASCTTAGNDVATVYMAPISSTGTIGTWSAQTSLGTGLYGLSATIYNGVVYVMGGINASTFQSAIYYQATSSTGTLTGTWSTSTQTMPATNKAYVGAAAYGGYMYLVGGCSAGATTCSTNTNNVYYAPITSGGDISSAFTSTGTFTNARGDLGVFVSDGYLYLTGGRNNTTYYNDTQFAPINTNGSVSTWVASSASTLSAARYGVGAAVYNGVLYVAGGYNGSTYYSDTQYAVIGNGDSGSSGTWQYTYNSASSSSFTGGFTTARDFFGTVVYNGYLYIVGGYNGTSFFKDVQYAPINANGTIGTWAATTSLSGARGGSFAAASNGYIYLTGGYDGTSYHNDVQYAPLNANGTIGTWGTTSTFTNPRAYLGAAIANGTLYITGGYNGSFANDVQYAPLNAIARVAHYSKVIDLGSAVNVTGITYNPVNTGNVTVQYRAAGSNAVFGSQNTANNISGAGGCSGNTTNTRYLFIFVTLDDSNGQGTGGTYPDPVGTSTDANLTDLTISYNPVHPAPNIRLRLGQTLQQGNLSPLDTCYP